jgi:hypothetical protein
MWRPAIPHASFREIKGHAKEQRGGIGYAVSAVPADVEIAASA